MGVHSAAWVLSKRLGHERCIYALLHGNFLDNSSEGHDVICGCQCICVAEVNFVLSWTCFVVTELNRNTDVFEHADRTATEIVSRATRHIVKVAGVVDWLGTAICPV